MNTTLKNTQRNQQGLAKQKRGQVGVNVVEQIVLSKWNSRWQQIDAQNDDGIDGLIFLEAGNKPTGQIGFAQVKCQQSPTNADGKVRVSIGRARLQKNIEKWRRVVGAAILIHVDPKTMFARWVNLRDPGSIGPSQVFVPLKNLFDASAKRTIGALCGAIHRDLLLKHVRTETSDFDHIRQGAPISKASLQLYNSFKHSPMLLGGSGPLVRFSGKGWKHITRPDRPRLIRYQSLVLLGVVRKLLEVTPENELTKFHSKLLPKEPFVAAKAAVSFPFRQTAVIKIVLRAKNIEGTKVYDFHTIYEFRRKRDVLGGRRVPMSPR